MKIYGKGIKLSPTADFWLYDGVVTVRTWDGKFGLIKEDGGDGFRVRADDVIDSIYVHPPGTRVRFTKTLRYPDIEVVATDVQLTGP